MIAVPPAGAGLALKSIDAVFKPAGVHDSVRALLLRLGLHKFTKVFRKHHIISVAQLRSIATMGALKQLLQELRMDPEDIRELSAAVLSTSGIEQQAATGGAPLVPAGSGDYEYVDDETDDEPDPMPLPEKPPDTRTKVHLTKEEYDEILGWSDDEDMTTLHGRFQHRQRTAHKEEHDRQYVLKAEDVGAIVDVSKGPRNILKKLLRGATGWQHPLEGFEVDLNYTARYCPTVNGPHGRTCGPPAGIFDDRFAEGKEPLHVAIGARELFPPLSEAVESMREGEIAEITIHPRVAYGAQGDAPRGIPAHAYLVYTVHLVRTYEVAYLSLGRIVKKVLVAPSTTWTPIEESEVTLEWQGKLLPCGTLFRPMEAQTFKLDAASLARLPPWWKTCLAGDSGVTSGGRGMGEGETAQFTIPPECAYGDKGDPMQSIPPNATLCLHVTLVQCATYEDITPNKEGTCIRKVIRRGTSEDLPRTGEECTVQYKIRNARTRRMYDEVEERRLVLGAISEEIRTSMRLASGGAYTDRALEHLLRTMRTGEKVIAHCTPAYIGGHGDDVEIELELKSFIKLILCPTDQHPLGDRAGRVEVRLHTDPSGRRGPNLESTCRVRYRVRCQIGEGSQESEGCHALACGLAGEGCRDREGRQAGEEGSSWRVVEEEGYAADELGHQPPFVFVQSQKQVMPAIDQAVLQMRPGGFATVSAPSAWAYGCPVELYEPCEAKCPLYERYKGQIVEIDLELVEVDRFKPSYAMELDEKIATQIRRKAQGNELFKLGDYEGALRRYDEALEYAAIGSEICMADIPYAEQRAKRMAIDANKMSTYVNMAMCHLKLGELGRPVLDSKTDGPSEDGTPPPSRAKKAIEQCDKALHLDTTNVKAHFWRGQAYKALGLLGRAKDDLISAARRDPRNREIVDEIDEVRRLEMEEKKAAKQLWKRGFLADQNALRAQQGAECVAKDANCERAARCLPPLVETLEDVVMVEEVETPAVTRAREAALGLGTPMGSSLGAGVLEWARDPTRVGILCEAATAKGQVMAGGVGRVKEGPSPTYKADEDEDVDVELVPWVPVTNQVTNPVPWVPVTNQVTNPVPSVPEPGPQAVASADVDADASDRRSLRMHKQLRSEAQSMHANPMGIDIKGDGGIMKRVLRAGSGIAGRPPADALCKVHYTGWLMDGTRFDSSRDRIGHPFVKLGSGTELGWLAAAVATMNRGELAEYVCRAEYAYGAKGWKGVGNKWLVPPCSTVRWELELYSWKGFTGNFSTMSDAEMMGQAYALKSQGTEYVRNCMYSEARERYHEACELIESPKFNVAEQLLSGRVAEAEILLLSCQLNEAFCELKREEYVAALRLCDKVLATPSRLTDEQKVKALYRSYQAYFGRQEYEQAMASLQLALEIDPNDKDVLDAVLSTKFTMRVAKLAQTAQFGGKFFSEESPDRSAALYKEATGIPSRPSARYGALPTAWLDLSVDAQVIGRVTIELFARQAPKTCENFRALCTGERGNGRLSRKPLHLQGTRFHRVIRNFLIQGGDIVHGDGKGGESIFGGQFDDEDLTGKFDAPGMVAMANGGRNMNGSQFFITTCEAPHLEGTHVVFGRVISGLEVVRQVERVRVSKNDVPLQPVLIDDCGSSFGVIPHGAVPPL